MNASGVEEHERVERVNSRRACHKHVTDTPSRAPLTRTSSTIMRATFLCASMPAIVRVETICRATRLQEYLSCFAFTQERNIAVAATSIPIALPSTQPSQE